MKHRRVTPASASLIVVALTFALAAGGCGKKKEEAAGAAKAAKETVAKIAEKVVPAAPKVDPLPEDVELTAGEGVVGWLTLRSVGATFDALETVAGKLGLAPPGASLRESAFNDLTLLLANNGITGHDWLDKANPVHIAFQDDDPNNPQGGAVLVLPVTDEKAALGAMKAAKTGAEAKGHKAMLMVEGKPIFIDFVDKYMVVSSEEKRFEKAKGFVGRLLKIKTPAVAYLGLSVEDATKTRKNEIDAMLAQLEQMQKAQMQGAGMDASDYYNKMVKEYLASLTRIELTLDGTAENLSLEVRMHAVKDSKLGKQFAAGRGKDATGLASTLPANSYMSFVAAIDPSASEAQIGDSINVLKTMFKLDDKAAAALEGDMRAALKLTDGTSGMALYPDGSAAIGLTAFAGSRDPGAVLKVVKRTLSTILLRALELEKEKQKKLNPKAADDPKLAIVESAIKDMKVDPLIQSFGPVATQAGVQITANTSKQGDVSCDVMDLTFDWTKLAKMGGQDAERGKALLGDRAALSLCTGKDRLTFSMGPSALEQGRRVAMSKPGGLADAPVYKAAAKGSVKVPSWLMYANIGTAMAAYKNAFPEVPAGFPADRAVVMGCGNRARSYACKLDVPVQVIHAIRTLTGN